MIRANLDVARTIANMSTNPITLRTVLNLKFNRTSDIEFINKLVWVVKSMLSITCYRKNIDMNTIELRKKDNDNKYGLWGNLIDLDNEDMTIEDTKYIMERIIDFDLMRESISCLFEMVSKGVVYLNHIPYSSKNRMITPDRFVMITAAFEWEFRHIYGNLTSEESEARKEARKELNEFIQKSIDVSTGKKKSYFKSYKKFLNNSDISLAEKIEKVLMENSNILDVFIKNLLNLNGIKDWKYKDIATRLQTQRNNYAHGNIDKDIDGVVILDLIILEWVIYTLILKEANMGSDVIQKSINKLFSRRIAL